MSHVPNESRSSGDSGEFRPVTLQVSCLNLRHKLMYVDERHATPGLVDDTSDTRVFWCLVTQESIGPDAGGVCPGDCHAGRSCYRAP